MAKYVIMNFAGPPPKEPIDDVGSSDPFPIFLSGAWEVTVLDEDMLLEDCRLWGLFESEEEAAEACAKLSDRMASPENDARRFIVGGIRVDEPFPWLQVGFELIWKETDD